MDLSKFTELELLDLRFQVSQELENYTCRDKKEVFKIFIEFDGTEYFIKKENAYKRLNELIEMDIFFDSEITVGKKFLNDAEIQKHCKDYEE